MKSCDRSDQVAATVICIGVVIAAHLIYWLLTGHFTISFWGRG